MAEAAQHRPTVRGYGRTLSIPRGHTFHRAGGPLRWSRRCRKSGWRSSSISSVVAAPMHEAAVACLRRSGCSPRHSARRAGQPLSGDDTHASCLSGSGGRHCHALPKKKRVTRRFSGRSRRRCLRGRRRARIPNWLSMHRPNCAWRGWSPCSSWCCSHFCFWLLRCLYRRRQCTVADRSGARGNKGWNSLRDGILVAGGLGGALWRSQPQPSTPSPVS